MHPLREGEQVLNELGSPAGRCSGFIQIFLPLRLTFRQSDKLQIAGNDG